VDKLKKVTQVATAAFPNGIAFRPTARRAVAESQKYQVLKYAVKADGSLGEKSVHCTLPGDHDPMG
jgi:sugar lactone lactonase YvrE